MFKPTLVDLIDSNVIDLIGLLDEPDLVHCKPVWPDRTFRSIGFLQAREIWN